MAVFRFQKFSVLNDRAAMKVNTDGVLLGALMTLGTGRMPNGRMKLLDIGTGTGTIALMAAQRLSESGTAFHIDAIDIDMASAEEAGLNFAASPWKEHLTAHHTSLSRFGTGRHDIQEETPQAGCGASSSASGSDRTADPYNHIFSNPPFFTETLHSPDKRKAATRHSDSLPLEEITAYASSHLEPDGLLSIILPFEQIQDASRVAAETALHLLRIVEIQSSDRKAPYRAILEFSPHRTEDRVRKDKLIINSQGKYTPEYLSLISPYLLLGR